MSLHLFSLWNKKNTLANNKMSSAKSTGESICFSTSIVMPRAFKKIKFTLGYTFLNILKYNTYV